jgi:hypothetical protein
LLMILDFEGFVVDSSAVDAQPERGRRRAAIRIAFFIFVVFLVHHKVADTWAK